MTASIRTNLFKASRKIFTLAVPMAMGQLINVASGFLCMAMLSALGHEVLAASALISSTQISIMVTGMSILFSISVLVGHAYGAKEYPSIGNYLQQGWSLALLMSLPIMVLFWHMDSILRFFGQPKEVTGIVHNYFHSYVWAVIPGFLSTCNMQFGYGIQKKKLIFSISALSVCLLLLTAYVLIFGKMGFPKLGVAGLGIATTVQFSFFFVLSTLIFYFNDQFDRFELFRYRVHRHFEKFVEMLKMGWPISIQMGGEMLSMFVSAILIGWLGANSLAAVQVANQYYFLIVVPIFSLSQASSIIIAHARGAEHFHEVERLSHASLVLALLASLSVGCMFLIFPKTLAAFFMDITLKTNAETLHLTILLFYIIAFTQVFDAVRNVMIGVTRGLFDTRFPMIMSLFTIWVIGMPLSYLLAFPLHFGVIGFEIGSLLGMLVGAIIMIFRGFARVRSLTATGYKLN